MSDHPSPPPFFVELQELCRKHGVVAHITVAVSIRDDSLVIGAEGGSRLDGSNPIAGRVLTAMGAAFDKSMADLMLATSTDTQIPN